MDDIQKLLESKRAAARLGGGEKRIEAQHKQGQADAPANAWNCCSTRARSKSGTCSCSTAAWTSAWTPTTSPATAWSPATAPSMAAWPLPTARTSRCSAARSVRGPCREDLQGHGSGHEGRCPGHRHERLGRRAHPGGRGLAGRLCRGVPAQCDGQRGDPAGSA